MTVRARQRDVEQQGERLLSAVERLIEGTDSLIARVEAYRCELPFGSMHAEDRQIEIVAGRIISRFSTKSAIAGAVTALPSVLPGGGTLAAVVGGSLVDMTFMLKHEVELALCLTHLYDHDIRNENERWLAYMLAAVTTYEAQSGRNYFVDIAEVQLEALRKYTPRQLTKLVVTAMGRTAMLRASRGVVRGVPLVGPVVGASANKILTTSVGWRCVTALQRRNQVGLLSDDPVVYAEVN